MTNIGSPGIVKYWHDKMATLQGSVMYGQLQRILRMLSSLGVRNTLTLLVFGAFVCYSSAETVVPRPKGSILKVVRPSQNKFT